jgi:hypothetical protein
MHATNGHRVEWPEGKTFAFTVFDDPDAQAYRVGRLVYSFLEDLGFRTTRGVWPGPIVREPNSGGETCDMAQYRKHNQELQQNGFEIGYHHTTPHDSTREEIVRGLASFRNYFGAMPSSMANHYNAEAIYWGGARLTQPMRRMYTCLTLGRTEGRFSGHLRGTDYFWGDICRQHIRYCRNFVYADVNTLAACPWMPYHDPLKPFVSAWYASSEGSNVDRFVAMLSDANQDRLESEGGACVMYTHFGHGFVENGRLHPGFRRVMQRLAAKNGWFVPVSSLLDYLGTRTGTAPLTDPQRSMLERRWLWQKLLRGTS